MSSYYEDKGWIYDAKLGWISPSGRTCDYPGGAFTGSVTREEHERLKRKQEEKEEKDLATEQTTTTVTTAAFDRWYRYSNWIVNIKVG